MIDFLIIGGGIAGVSAAARLSELGTVVLLEAESHLAYHTSGRSAALFEENYGKPSTIALNKQSHDFHKKAGVLKPRGLLLIGDADNATAFEEDKVAMNLSSLTVNEAISLFPVLDATKVDRAAYDPDAWDIDTDLLIQTFLNQAKQNGAKVVAKAPVTGIESIGTGWTVTTQSDRFEARQIVNAAGAWADEIAKLAGVQPIGLSPLRRSMARLPVPAGMDIQSWPMLFGPGEDWYAKPDAGALLVSPAEEDPTHPHDAVADDLTIAEGIEKFSNYATMHIRRPISTWAGLRTFAPDRNLVLGPDPVTPTFIWCAGQGGYGMQSAPGASAYLADVIAGRPTAIVSDVRKFLDPARFQ